MAKCMFCLDSGLLEDGYGIVMHCCYCPDRRLPIRIEDQKVLVPSFALVSTDYGILDDNIIE